MKESIVTRNMSNLGNIFWTLTKMKTLILSGEKVWGQ